MLMEGLFSRTFFAWLCDWCLVCILEQTRDKCHITVKATHRLLRFALVVCSLLCKAIKKKRHITVKKTNHPCKMEGLFSRTFFAWLCDWCLVCILEQTRDKCHISVKATHRLLRFALVVCSLLCKAIKKKRHITLKKTNHPCKMEGLFSRTFFAWLCDWCLVCILEQTRDKCHITVKATHRLLRFALVVCSLLCKAIKKKRHITVKKTNHPCKMDGLFSRTFFAWLCDWCLVCILEQTRDKCHITVKATHRLLRFALGVCSLLCKAIKKKRHITVKKTNYPCKMEGLFSRTFFAWLCDWCLVCILEQTRDKCHISVKATHRLLRFALVCSLLCKAIKKSAILL